MSVSNSTSYGGRDASGTCGPTEPFDGGGFGCFSFRALVLSLAIVALCPAGARGTG